MAIDIKLKDLLKLVNNMNVFSINESILGDDKYSESEYTGDLGSQFTATIKKNLLLLMKNIFFL